MVPPGSLTLCGKLQEDSLSPAMYAKFAYIIFGREEREGAFFKKMLIHESDTVSQAYETVKVPEELYSQLTAFKRTEQIPAIS